MILVELCDIFFIKHKSDASKCLVDCHKVIKVLFEKHIKRIRCENDGKSEIHLQSHDSVL